MDSTSILFIRTSVIIGSTLLATLGFLFTTWSTYQRNMTEGDFYIVLNDIRGMCRTLAIMAIINFLSGIVAAVNILRFSQNIHTVEIIQLVIVLIILGVLTYYTRTIAFTWIYKVNKPENI